MNLRIANLALLAVYVVLLVAKSGLVEFKLGPFAPGGFDTAVPVRETRDIEPWLTKLLVESRDLFEEAGFTFNPLDPDQVDENGQPPARWAAYLNMVSEGAGPTLVVGTGLEAKKAVPITQSMTPQQLLEAAE